MDQEQKNATAVSCRLGEQEMFALIEKRKQMHISVRTFCAEHNISHSRFYYWLRKYRDRPSDIPEPSGFTLLNIEPERSSPFCELVTRGGSRLRFFQPVGAPFLKSLL